VGSLSEQERNELERLLGKVTEDIEAQGGERIRLLNGQLVRLSYGFDEQLGYRRAQVTLGMPERERAIWAGFLAAAEPFVNPKRIPYAVRELWAARPTLEPVL
jgi:hypothetical protein